MNKPVKHQNLILISNGLIRLFGNVVKFLSYPFHAVFPKKRFTIPEFSPARHKSEQPSKINKTIWQTNYSNKVTLPVYCNYLLNRALSWDYDYRYVSTEARADYIKAHAAPRLFEAYSKLTDGAAQADFWRIFTLYHEGGVYLDIDGHLVWGLSAIIDPEDSEVLITRRDKYTNFFLASAKGNPFLKDTLDIIVDNIEQRRIQGGVFVLTGPITLNQALKGKDVNTRRDKFTAAQGSFTNEHFQYMDKKHGKWNHTKNEDLLK
ncbi:glycosyltransferase [Pasteurellaceae bacterium LIM206]|nr:glycosyltransferase [Pasteurellaceae bacterium LIM206]